MDISTVQTKVFDPICSSCHSGNRPAANLRLGRRADPAQLRDTLLNQPTSATGTPYITPFDPQKSFLYRKAAGTQGALDCPRVRGCGFKMPPSGGLNADRLRVLEEWINSGAP